MIVYTDTGFKTNPTGKLYGDHSVSEWEAQKRNGSDHYKTGGGEPIDLYKAGGFFEAYAIASIIKYAFRCRPENQREVELIRKDMDKIVDLANKITASLPVKKQASELRCDDAICASRNGNV